MNSNAIYAFDTGFILNQFFPPLAGGLAYTEEAREAIWENLCNSLLLFEAGEDEDDD